MKTKKEVENLIEPTAESNYDSAWKDVIEKLFEQFLEFFFPHIHQGAGIGVIEVYRLADPHTG